MKWFFFFVLLTVGLGLFLNGDFEIPFTQLQWVGHLPGDLILRKNGVEIYFPLTTSLLLSLVLSFLFTVLKRKFDA